MRRSILLQVTVHCPHHGRPVVAVQNEAIGRLVHCDSNLTCREARDGVPAEDAPFPRGCPVYPQLAQGR